MARRAGLQVLLHPVSVQPCRLQQVRTGAGADRCRTFGEETSPGVCGVCVGEGACFASTPGAAGAAKNHTVAVIACIVECLTDLGTRSPTTPTS